MTQTTANADAILQNYYLPVVREMVNQRAILLFGYSPAELENGSGSFNAIKGETMDYRGISRDGDQVEFAGRQWVIALHTTRNESGTARAEGGTLPAPGQQGWADLIDKIKKLYKQIQITGFALEVSERSVGAYLRLLEAETVGAVNDLRKDMNRQAYGDGRGTLCQITADGVNTVTVDNLQYLRVGMIVDVVNQSTDAVLASQRTISAINTATRVVTYSGADVTAVAGTHVLCVEGNWKLEINGLRNITRSDLSQNYILHGIDSSVAGNEYWKAKQKDGGNTTFDEDQGQLLLDQIGAEGYETELILTTRGIRRRYANTLKSGKRWNDASAGTMHGGFKYIDYNGFPLLFDDDCPKQHMFFIRPSDYLWVNLNGMDFRWMNRDGAILRKVESPDQDAYKATLYKYADLGVQRRAAQGVIYNLADDIP
ncbi:MAG TPA: phage major capsid protein [Propionibacteriaceae bacterium]|nr:phage major capsid protein [Propionibacteriaceae bacterium]